MDFLKGSNVRRDMLFEICAKTGIVTQPNLRKDQLRDLIKNSDFPVDEVAEILEDLLESRRKASSEDGDSQSSSSSSGSAQQRIKVTDLLKGFCVGSDFILFLVNFERLCVLLKIEKNLWVSNLLALLPVEANETIARLDESVAFDYEAVKTALLAKYRLNSEQLRRDFRGQRKLPSETYSDLAYRIRTTMSAWLKSCEADTVDKVQQSFAIEQFRNVLPDRIKGWLSDQLDNSHFESLESLSRVIDVYVAKHGSVDPGQYSQRPRR
jgi:hypothetical protein